MNALAVTLLFYTLGSAPSAQAQASGLATTVRACRADDRAACDRLEKRLEALFVGSRDSADRALGHKLACAATRLLRDDRAPRAIVEPIARCASNDAGACDRIANVLAGLFTGSDAQLDSSRDRALARAFASRLVSEVHP